MTTPNQFTMSNSGPPPQERGTRTRVSKTAHFIRHLLEMLLAMGAGMILFHLLVALISTTTDYAALFAPRTSLHAITMTVFMTVPMVAWMVVRGHGWHHSAEMVVAMLAPTATVALLCQLGANQYMPWLADASGPAMLLGMLTAMLYRLDHYTRPMIASTQSAHLGNSSCHAG